MIQLGTWHTGRGSRVFHRTTAVAIYVLLVFVVLHQTYKFNNGSNTQMSSFFGHENSGYLPIDASGGARDRHSRSEFGVYSFPDYIREQPNIEVWHKKHELSLRTRTPSYFEIQCYTSPRSHTLTLSHSHSHAYTHAYN